jgi:hypothetical protein
VRGTGLPAGSLAVLSPTREVDMSDAQIVLTIVALMSLAALVVFVVLYHYQVTVLDRAPKPVDALLEDKEVGTGERPYSH